MLLPGCTVVTVTATAVSVTATAVGLAADVAVGTAKVVGHGVGAAVDEGLVLQALGPRQAQLGRDADGPATLTLDMPLKR